MGRIYSVSFAGTITNAGGDADLLELLPADDKPIRLRGWSIGQTSEVGDAQEEGLRISVIRLPATVTSGSSPTPIPTDSADSAAGFAAEINNTTIATTSSTAVTCGEHAWNERGSPWDFFYPDERFCPKAKQGEALAVRLQTTAADDLSVACTFWVEEE
jgi:hypothetical protein